MIKYQDDNYVNRSVALAFAGIGLIGLWLHGKNASRLQLLKKILPPGFVILHYHFLIACLGILAPFPFAATCAYFNRWLFGNLGCQIYAFVGMVAGECMITLTCTISYLHMMSYTKSSWSEKLKPGHYQLIAIAHWAFAFAISALPLLGFGRYDLEPHKTSCLFSWMNMDKSTYWYMVLICIVGYLIPMCFGLFALSKTIRLSNMEDEDLYAQQQQSKLNENFRTITWLNAWILLFVFLSWIPFGIIGFQSLIFGSPTIGINSYYIPQLVAKFGTALIPMAYTGTMKKLTKKSRKN